MAEQGFTLARSTILKLKRTVEQQQHAMRSLQRRLSLFGLRRHESMTDRLLTTVRFKNTSGETVPAFGVMRIVSTARAGARQLIYTIGKPNTTFYRLYLVNGPAAVSNNGHGRATFLTAGGLVLYDTGTPALGESWGPKNNQWALTKWRYGFTILGGNDTTALTTFAKQEEVNEVYGQTNGAINKGSTGTVDLYDGNNAAITSTSITVTNRFANVATSEKVLSRWTGGTWLLTAAEC